jgi:hypothetical protein
MRFNRKNSIKAKGRSVEDTKKMNNFEYKIKSEIKAVINDPTIAKRYVQQL